MSDFEVEVADASTMRDVPGSWSVSLLCYIAYLGFGQSPPSSTYNTTQNGLPFFQGKAEFGRLYPTVEKWCTAPTRIAEKGDILLSIRAPVGPTNIAPARCGIGRGLASIRPNSEVSRDYLLYYLRHIAARLAAKGTGTTFSAITKPAVQTIRVPVPPHQEQRRIASKIDELFSRIDEGERALERVQKLLERYRQSVLKAAVTGELTREWREQNRHLNSNLEVGPLGKWVTVQGGFAFKSGDYKKQGIPLIRISNLNGESVEHNHKSVYLPEEYAELHKNFLVSPGDILIAMSGATTGKMGTYISDDKALLNQRVGRFLPRKDRQFNPVFLKYLIWGLREQILAEAYGGAQPNISPKKIEEIEIAIPTSTDEQAEVASQISRHFSLAEAAARTCSSGINRSTLLRQAVLKQAFSGNLVPQDPTDEPASVLLERIAAERAASKSTPPKRTRRKKVTA